MSPTQNPSEIEFRPLLELSFAESASLFNRCFENYVIQFTVTASSMAAHSRKDGVDHARSFIAVRDGQDVAMALIAPRFDAARLAGMGVVKEARGSGVGRIVVDEFLHRLRSEGFREAVLEVFEQNEPAVQLYQSAGFRPTQRLLGFERQPFVLTQEVPVAEASFSDYTQAIAREELTYGQAADHQYSNSLPTKCWTVDGNAFAIFAAPQPGAPLFLSAFFVRHQARGQGRGRQLFEAIQSAHPTSPWVLRQVFPESTAPFLEHLGFVRMPLNQFEMRLRL